MGLPVKLGMDRKIAFYASAALDNDSHVAALATGGFVIAQTEGAGTANPDATLVAYSGSAKLRYGRDVATSATDEIDGTVVGLKDGSYYWGWRSTPDATGNADIKATRVDDNNPTNNVFQFTVNFNAAANAGAQGKPEFVELANGPMAAVWIDDQTNQIKSAIFTQAGTSLASNITVSATAASQGGMAFDLGVAALQNGAYVVTWRNDANDAKFRIVSQAGSFVTGEMDVTTTANPQGSTDVATLSDGRFCITFFDTFGGAGLYGKIFNADGTMSVDRFHIATTSGYQSMTALRDGRFMVVYDTAGDIFGRVMNANGTPSSDEFRINDDVSGVQSKPSVATLADGRVVVSWTDDRTGAGDTYFTVYDPRESGAMVTGTAHADEYVGSAFADSFNGQGGDDVLDGGAGVDNAVFSGARASYLVFGNADGSLSIKDTRPGSPDGTDTLKNIESAIFADGARSTATLAVPRADVDGDRDSDILVRDGEGTVQARLTGPNDQVTLSNLGAMTTNWTTAKTADFTGDGVADILWRHPGGTVALWTIVGGQVALAAGVGTMSAEWAVGGTGDVTGDGIADVLWRHSSGAVALWKMQNGALAVESGVGSFDLSWAMLGVADINGDGWSDVLWRHDGGAVAAWLMQNGAVAVEKALGALDPSWSFGGAGDFNGDGQTDVLWRHGSGAVAEWLMQGGSVAVEKGVGFIDAAWSPAETGDYNKDGTADVLWRHSGGFLAQWLMQGGNLLTEKGAGQMNPDYLVI